MLKQWRAGISLSFLSIPSTILDRGVTLSYLRSALLRISVHLDNIPVIPLSEFHPCLRVLTSCLKDLVRSGHYMLKYSSWYSFYLGEGHPYIFHSNGEIVGILLLKCCCT